jgi:hypothetical protein
MKVRFLEAELDESPFPWGKGSQDTAQSNPGYISRSHQDTSHASAARHSCHYSVVWWFSSTSVAWFA